MAQPITSQTSHALFQHEFSPAQLTFGAALRGGSNAIAAALFTSMSPLGGAIFGVSSFLSERLIHWICAKTTCSPEDTIFKIAQFALSVIGGIASGVAITTAIGFPMTILGGVVLNLASIGVTAASFVALGGCLCSSAVATGLALGNDNREVTVQV